MKYEPRRRSVDKSLVADKWKSEPVLCEPKEETPKATLKLGSVPDIPAESLLPSGHSPKALKKPTSVDEIRTRAIMGHVNFEVPDVSRIIRMYISSTFTGMVQLLKFSIKKSRTTYILKGIE